MTETYQISPTTRWAGDHHETEYGCAYCGYAWPTADQLRKHLNEEHPDVTIIEAPA